MELCGRLLQDHNGWESFSCSAHYLQLCVNKGLEEIRTIKKLVTVAKKLVSQFFQTFVASEALKAAQREKNMDVKVLIQECSTRWNSTFYMVERLVELRWAVVKVLNDDRVTKRQDRSLNLTDRQWRLAEQLINMLKSLEIATTLFSYNEHVSMSNVLSVLKSIVQNLDKPVEVETTGISDKDDEDQDRIVGELPAIRDYQNTVKKAQRKDGIL